LTLVAAALLKDLILTPAMMGVMGYGWTAPGRPMMPLAAGALVTGLIGPLAFAGMDRILALFERRG
jgi:hypothetical protein